ncbi:MAG: TlyA family rRNA (cytidine-2'-O)-methyltransferase [Zoogloeaceae bacterium]|jgi:23S rRNA (cytidine1920-2'-O)/16S rRNA (cytidine1409-2'-O)-methyltransferase|nr:TlyA family rRNA (cytidine-2'-O)-methyltransferase [Zoogloeaceae bacterium]
MSMNAFHARQRKPDAPAARRAAFDQRLAPCPALSDALRTRADVLLAAQFDCSRARAKWLIQSGKACCADIVIRKPTQELPRNSRLTLAENARGAFVSRGGDKLAGALAHTRMSVAGCYCLDVGQSTGGFTDCLLTAGAARVTGVDVGQRQLAPRLLSDPRVRAFTGINCRTLTAADLGEAFPPRGFDRVTVDVSFISLTLILPSLSPLLAADGQMLLLVKPQFEVGPGGVGKGGIVRDARLYAEVEAKLRRCCAVLALNVRQWFASSLTGSDGNHEFFLWTSKA